MKRAIGRRAARIGLAALAALSLAMSGTALAVSLAGRATHTPTHVLFSGKGLTGTVIATDSEPQEFISASYQSLAGATNTVSVPSGTTRLASATFAAASQCAGTNAGCIVRIVARKVGTSTLTEFYPRDTGGTNFDSTPGSQDFWESHSITRSKTLSAGTWYVYVQARTTNGQTNFDLGSWSHRVDVFAK